jgi:benzoylformate decarboxylase
MVVEKSVHDVTYDLVHSLALTTVFDHQGSAGQAFLKNSPDDFTDVGPRFHR